MYDYFFTRHGLKVRLNLSFFIYLLTGVDDCYSMYDALANPVINTTLTKIERRYNSPSMLKWVFTILAMFFCSGMNLPVFVLVLSGLHIFALIWRTLRPDLLIFISMSILEKLYSCFDFVWWGPLVPLVIIGLFKNIPMLIAYGAVSLIMGLVFLIFNNIALKVTLKKYGRAFSHAEFSAFVEFYIALKRMEKFSDFIRMYCEYENKQSEISEIKEQTPAETESSQNMTREEFEEFIQDLSNHTSDTNITKE